MPPQAKDPTVIGRYRLLTLLGKGGTARVYRAVREGAMGFEKDVAIKVIDKEASLDREATVSLVNEARLGCLLRHPNIVRIDEFEHEGDAFYMTMEYIEGWPLDRILRNFRSRGAKPDFGVVLRILGKVCEALEYAHTLNNREGASIGIVHRDLKPGNVMVSSGGEVKIADFGTAKAATNISQTQEGFTRGTPAYMSPEQVAGAPVDFRSDIFSLGALIYELFCLELMFRGTNMVAVMHRVVQADITDAMERLREVAPALVPIVSRCMALQPSDRYSSAAEVAEDLELIRDLYPTEVSIASWTEELAAKLDPITGTPLNDQQPPGHSTHADTLLAPTDMEIPIESLAVEAIRPLGSEDNESLIMPTSSPLGPKADTVTSGLSEISPTIEMPGAKERAAAARRKEEFALRLNPSAPQKTQQPSKPVSVQARTTPSRPPSRRIRPWFIVWILVFTWRTLSSLGPALPGELGAGFGALRDWQVRLVRREEVPSLIGVVDQAGDDGEIELAQFEGGTIRLGAPDQADADLATGELQVPGGLLMTYEVTVGDYRTRCPREWWQIDCKGWPGPREGQTLDHPVVDVTWSQAKHWCEAQGWRLPTEVEWEFAARGAGGRTYPWGENHRPGVANYCDVGCEQSTLAVTWENDTYNETAPVGSFPAGRSPDGVHDLAGNAAEWVLDCWLPHHEGRTSWSDRAGGSCIQRTVRGGSWRDSWGDMAAWRRRPLTAETGSGTVGFRCIKAGPLAP